MLEVVLFLNTTIMIIQKIHRSLSHSFFIIPLCLLVLFVTTSAKAHPAMSTADYSGEELFRGIYFAQGPVADQISMLKAFDINRFVKDAAKKREITTFQNNVVAKIAKDHPSFLTELQASVNSRNNFKIKNTLLKGNEILLSVSSALSGTERDLKKEAAFKEELGKKVDLNKASAAEIGSALEEMAAEAIVVDIWILLPVCIVLMCWVVVYIGNVEMQPDGLFQEQLVSAISKL